MPSINNNQDFYKYNIQKEHFPKDKVSKGNAVGKQKAKIISSETKSFENVRSLLSQETTREPERRINLGEMIWFELSIQTQKYRNLINHLKKEG